MADVEKLLNQQHQQNKDDFGAAKWEPEKGDVIEGILTKTGWYDGGEYDPSLWLLIKDMDTGDSTRVYCPTVLKNQVTDGAPKIGSGVAIRYEGREEGKSGRKYHNYTFVMVPDDDGNAFVDHEYWRREGNPNTSRSLASQRSGRDADEDTAEDKDGWF